MLNPRLILPALTCFILTSCASIEKYDQVDIGMSQPQVEALLGETEFTREVEVGELHQYTLREQPTWWGLTMCAVIPPFIPLTSVMWLSDGCLGERVVVDLTYTDGVLADKQRSQ